MKSNRRGSRLVWRVFALFVGALGVFLQMASARPQQLDKQISVQEGQVAGPVRHVEIGFQSFNAIVPGKVVKGAPYSAMATTEMTQVLSDGNQISHKMTSNIYRDSQGRTRREENSGPIGLVLINGNRPPSVVFISDPVSGSDYILEPENKIARKMQPPPANAIATRKAFPAGAVGSISGAPGAQANGDVFYQRLPDGAPGAQANGDVFYQRVPDGDLGLQVSKESLGQQTIEGVVAEGKRTTTTIPAGTMGNQRPISTVTEEWFSSELQAVVLSTTKDPRMGETTYRLSNIQRTEPPLTFFTVPADYTVKD
jgi:hypothetical protein